MTNKAKLALIAAVAAVSVVSPALAQSQIVSPPNTAVPPSLFVPQTGQTFQKFADTVRFRPWWCRDFPGPCGALRP